MILPIRIWPDSILLEKAKPVVNFNSELTELINSMFETMYAAPGRGLAAPQVGVSLRLFVMDTTWKDGDMTPRVFINPEIMMSSKDDEINSEGCLSLPEFSVPVKRPSRITLKWQGPTGEFFQEDMEGFAAICAQHEFDHLDGILTIDRIDPDARAAIADILLELEARA